MTRLQIRMPGHDREKSLGHLGAAWIEHFFRHGPGPIGGQPYRLDDHFYDLLTDAYALENSGRRLYMTVVMSAPKGTSKSEFAGAVTLFEVHGPCRFAGWAKGGEVFEQYDFRYVYQPGEPMGRLIRDPYARLLATEEGQTGNTYRNVRANLSPGYPLHQHVAGYREFQAGKTMAMLPGNAQIWPSTAGAASKDGGLETFAVADETHLYATDELRDMYETVDQNLPKRGMLDEPWMLATTTMYRAGQNSVAEQQHKLALAINEGKVTNPGMLYDHIEGGTIVDLADTDRLREVLHEAYADRDWINYDRYVARAQDPTKDPARFRRYYLNQQAAGAEAYVSDQELRAIATIDGEEIAPLKRGDVITLGFDYAPGNRGDNTSPAKRRRLRVPDATALVACRLTDMTLHPLGIWEADEVKAISEGWNPPMLDIENTVHDAFKQYDVVAMFADPSGIESYLDKWTARYLSKLKVRATGERPMYRYMSGKSATRSGKDVDALYEAIATQQAFMAPHPVMTRHFLNARRSSTQYGTALYKPNPDSPLKIDAAVASVLAHAAAVLALNKGLGVTTKTRGRVRRLY